MRAPIIGITADYASSTAGPGAYTSKVAYSRRIAEAGGVPVLLPHELGLVDQYISLCDGLLLTGGADVRMEKFGVPMHPKADPINADRQAFELAILDALERQRDKPLLGICFSMQLMSMHAGGKLNQHLPDTLPNADEHLKDHRHPVVMSVRDGVWGELKADDGVVSNHHQGVTDAGRLRVVGKSPDGVIEAVDDPTRPFYLGVQWHPERGGDGSLSLGLLKRFVAAARSATSR